jgi:hypothetical protein
MNSGSTGAGTNVNNAAESKPPPISLTDEEVQDLFRAKMLLENPGLAARLANVLGAPIERGFAMLPKNWSAIVNRATRSALLRALDMAVRSLKSKQRHEYSELTHKVMVGTSGCIGGAFGFAALVVELPISTTIMLRSIADIARDEGHSLTDIETRLSCLEVFALGGPSTADDATESAYWVVRAAMSKAISEATTYLAERGVLEKGAPAIVRLVATIASRFGVVISEQAAAKAVPIIGAASGSVVNVLFMDHFQNMARGHFIVKRIEKKFGTDKVREVYASLAMPVPAQ